jgi:two-component system, LytTR family, response regulator
VPEPLTVAVVDDEPLAREGLRLVLAEDPEVKVVGEAGSGDEALALLARTHPKLVFLDVQMPGGDGFDVLARAEPPLPLVLFVTAYDQYALEAFRIHAFDYLLKPYEDCRVREALARAKAQLEREEAARLGEALRTRAVEAGLVSPSASRIVVRDRGRIIFLEAEEIDWIESADYYVELHVGPRTYLHRESMAALEGRLDPQKFVRIHRTAIVNRRVLRELRRTGTGGLVAVLATGAELPVARSQQARIRQLR